MKKYPYKDLGKKLTTANVEKNETILTPDGYFYGFKDKLHSQGGEEILALPGSRVFSHKLKADKDIVKSVTGYSGKKRSFADLSKKYDPTEHNKQLENKLGINDDLALRTHELMRNKLRSQLDNVFYSQEAFKAKKGMKNDLPALQQEGQEQGGVMFARYGGVKKYNTGGLVPPIYEELLALNPNFNFSGFAGVSGYNPGTPIPGMQSGNNSFFGGVPEITPEHITAYTFATGKTPTPNEFSKWYMSNVANLVTDESGTGNNLYGRYFSNAPLRVNSLDGTKSGEFTLQDYLNNPQKIFSDFGLNKNQVDDLFRTPGTYYANVNGTTPEPIVATRQPGITAQGLEPFKPVPFEKPLIGSEELLGVKPQLPKKEKPNVEQKRYRDEAAILDNLKMGLSLADLGTLSKDTPYYSGYTLKAPQYRYKPIDTRNIEKNYQRTSRSINENRYLSDTAKAALLSQNVGEANRAINEVNINNYSNINEVRNKNSEMVVNTYNKNKEIQTGANALYDHQLKQTDEVYNQSRNNIMAQLFNVADNRQYINNNRRKLSELSNNYYLDRQGNIRYVEGSKPNVLDKPLAEFNLENGADRDKIESMIKQLNALLKETT